MIIVRYAEVALKGKNRPSFERRLVENIRICLKENKIPCARIERVPGRILVYTDSNTDCLRHVFGISSFSHALDCGTSLTDIQEILPRHVRHISADSSFRITCKRVDKSFPHNRQAVERQIGAFVQGQTQATVDLTSPDHVIRLEIVKQHIWLCTNKIECFGGLPVGIEGRVILWIEKSQDLLAGLLFLKRGAGVMPVSDKEQDISLLKKFSHGKECTLFILDKSHLGAFAKKKRIPCVISGQTLKDFTPLSLPVPVLRPLIGYTDERVEEQLHEFHSV